MAQKFLKELHAQRNDETQNDKGNDDATTDTCSLLNLLLVGDLAGIALSDLTIKL